jgi:hypothetical protein
MKGLLVVLVLLVGGTLGLGFYLGWFQFSRSGEGQKTNYTISVDRERIQEDANKAKERVRDIGQDVKERTGTDQ